MTFLSGLFRETARQLRHQMRARPFEPPRSRVLYDLRTPDAMAKWFCRCDSEIGGLSSVSLEHEQEALVMRGELSTKVPEGSRLVQSGYAFLRSHALPSSLMGPGYHDLSGLDGIEVTLRGDGRTYIANIQTDGLQPDDLYQAFVYTRGGPEIQTIQIPFADFLLTSRGTVQNHQQHMDQSRITTFGMLMADRLDGPFELAVHEVRVVTMTKLLSNYDAGNDKTDAVFR